jgi:hypothetical protein
MAVNTDNVLQGSIAKVKANIKVAYDKRSTAAYALCNYYAKKAQQNFIHAQGTAPDSQGKYWHNQTGDAARGVVGFTDKEPEYVSWGLAHTIKYGVFLELSNSRKHESLRPNVESLYPDFIKAVGKIYHD